MNTQLTRRNILKAMVGGTAIAATGGVLTACSNPSPTYYALSSIPGQGYSTNPFTIEVITPSLAGFLDKDRIVTEIDNNQLTISSSAAWGENIANMIGRTMMLNLAQRLPNARVFLQNQATVTKPRIFVEMDISKFNQDSSGKAIAAVNLVVRFNNDDPAQYSRLLTLEKTPADGGAQALVVALSQILAEIADTATTTLVDMSRMPDPNKDG